MGPANSKEPQPTSLDSEIKIKHEKFQSFTYLQPEDLLQIVLQVQNEKDMQAWQSQLKRLNSFEDKEALLTPRRQQYQSRGFCGSAGSVKICYENYPYLFEEEIDNRIEMGKHFSEEELWYLLYSLTSAARDFSKLGSKVGDIRPYNIFINEEGQLKIANLFSWPYEKTNFEKTAFERQTTYLAPEEIRLIAKGNHENQTNKIISESFSIGLTLLQSGLLFQAKQLYSVEHYSFDLELLNRKLSEWEHLQFQGQNNNYHTYSPLLKQAVAGLCHPDDRIRLTSLALEEHLRPHQNEILNLKEFDHRLIQLPNNQPPQPQQPPAVPLELTYNSLQKNTGSPTPSGLVLLPQQTIKVGTSIEPKYNSVPTEYYRESARVPPAQITFAEPITNDNYSQEQIHKYSTNPVEIRTQGIEGNYQQQFFKYASLNQNAQTTSHTTPQINFGPPPTFSQPTNTLNLGPYSTQPPSYSQPNFPLNQPTLPLVNPPFAPASTYVPASFTSTFSQGVPVSSAGFNPIATSQTHRMGVSSSASVLPPSSDPAASDFLRRIDEQLESSRRQFPS